MQPSGDNLQGRLGRPMLVGDDNHVNDRTNECKYFHERGHSPSKKDKRMILTDRVKMLKPRVTELTYSIKLIVSESVSC
jgi:hypothetical protein